jgi:hypothetical protein
MRKEGIRFYGTRAFSAGPMILSILQDSSVQSPTSHVKPFSQVLKNRQFASGEAFHLLVTLLGEIIRSYPRRFVDIGPVEDCAFLQSANCISIKGCSFRLKWTSSLTGQPRESVSPDD